MCGIIPVLLILGTYLNIYSQGEIYFLSKKIFILLLCNSIFCGYRRLGKINFRQRKKYEIPRWFQFSVLCILHEEKSTFMAIAE